MMVSQYTNQLIVLYQRQSSHQFSDNLLSIASSRLNLHFLHLSSNQSAQVYTLYYIMHKEWYVPLPAEFYFDADAPGMESTVRILLSRNRG